MFGMLIFYSFPSAVKPQVIDYGHGSKTDDPLADLDREADKFERSRSKKTDLDDVDDDLYSRG
jgi:hypothetical protein